MKDVINEPIVNRISQINFQVEIMGRQLRKSQQFVLSITKIGKELQILKDQVNLLHHQYLIILKQNKNLQDQQLQNKNVEDQQLQNKNVEDEQLLQDYFSKNALIDLIIVIDTTVSMNPYLNSAKQLIKNIVRKCKQVNPKANLRVAIVSFKEHILDKNGEQHSYSKVCEGTNFFTDAQQIQNIIDNLRAEEGGKNTHKAVFDGLGFAGMKLRYHPKGRRIAFLILADPPYGKEYHNKQDADDSYPEGCPCGITIHDISQTFNQKRIHLSVKTPKDKIFQKMNQNFKTCFKSYSFSTFSENIEQLRQKKLTNIINLMKELKFKRKEFNGKLQKFLDKIRKDIFKHISSFNKYQEGEKMKIQMLKRQQQLREKFAKIQNINEDQLYQYALLILQYLKQAHQMSSLRKNMQNIQ